MPPRSLLAAALLSLAMPLLAHAALPPPPLDGAQLKRQLERLSSTGRVLYVAAHPDDENTRLLAWLVASAKVDATYLSITRGDGGQNLIGTEQGPLLGLLRTEELLAARRVDGASQLFTRALDFGFCKTPAEALATWGKDEVLADVVLAIRRARPDVVITRFPTSGMETHGHHTASAILAAEAFQLAGDAKYHPEQPFPAWKPRRLVFNKPMFFARPNEDVAGFLAVDVGGYDPLLGTSAGEVAATSRTMHKSQGFGVAPQRGPQLEYFKVLDGEPFPAGAKSPLDGIDTSWRRVPKSEALATLLAKAARELDPAQPAKVLPTLGQALAALDKLPRSPLTDEKRRALVELMLQAAGVWLDATAAAPTVAPGGVATVTVQAIARVPTVKVAVDELRVTGARGAIGSTDAVKQPEALVGGKPLERKIEVTLPPTVAPSHPYWLVEPPQAGRYVVAPEDAALVGLPESPPALSATVALTVGGAHLTVERAVVHRWVDPVHGERWRPLEIAPPVTVTPSFHALMFPDAAPRDLLLTLRAPALAAGAPPVAATVSLELPAGFHAQPVKQPAQLLAGEETVVRFAVTPPAATARGGATIAAAQPFVTVDADATHARLDRGLVRVEHPHVPTQTLYPTARVRLERFDLAHRTTRLAYIPGPGDEVADALRGVGYDVTLIPDRLVTAEALAPFRAAVVGVRAFNASPLLAAKKRVLLDWVARGGTLVVQYNTNSRIGPAPPDLGPWPFTISQLRVTDEKAPVEIALPNSIVVQRPNRITDADFAGWVQERGLYFADPVNVSPRYELILSMHDPGEPPQKGSLLVGAYEKGWFVYTGLSFFRQLPAGVPGAFRLFANLLDLGAAAPSASPPPRAH